ncbi:MAG: HPr(Ser) kinase/phosphatase [candidate division Zixibacteria bacterium]|nr:HPr(Ser) kinase/phosphatase [candidate division Zixibacteria bacterium]MBU1469993.1 HPr(Ser) kinase/phosphatase [candidate division Zixibacteria bacterium]MBU2626173.1 HPr(Ser) kinase/phosphatase [candidate division Zixibacteria bacterium]
MPEITVEKLFNDCKEEFEMYLLTGQAGLKKKITTAAIHRPGLALAGFTKRFPHKRTLIIGETEIAFITSCSAEERKRLLREFFSFDLPVLVVTKGINPPQELIDTAIESNTAVLQTRLTTAEFVNQLSGHLDDIFAPRVTVHGTLVDVYGVGLLYTGKSGIGKSECALDLAERGHRVVADDMIRIVKKSPNLVVGTGSELLGHHMEVRGIGIIDIERLFGIRAIRMQKRIEVEVRLVLWNETMDSYERLGMEEKYTSLLGVEIPVITIPVSPGKNITVISEVIAMNHMQKTYGENTAVEFSRRLSEKIQRQLASKVYLQSDYE